MLINSRYLIYFIHVGHVVWFINLYIYIFYYFHNAFLICSILDYTYNGWGLKWNVIDYTPQMLDEYKFEHLKDTEETTEIHDPTHADEQSFFSNVQRLKELKKNMKSSLKPFTMFDGDEEDEEKIINNYTYN